MNMYDAQTARLDESLHSLEQQIKRLDEDMDAIRKNLAGMNATSMMNEARSVQLVNINVQTKTAFNG